MEAHEFGRDIVDGTRFKAILEMVTREMINFLVRFSGLWARAMNWWLSLGNAASSGLENGPGPIRGLCELDAKAF